MTIPTKELEACPVFLVATEGLRRLFQETFGWDVNAAAPPPDNGVLDIGACEGGGSVAGLPPNVA